MLRSQFQLQLAARQNKLRDESVMKKSTLSAGNYIPRVAQKSQQQGSVLVIAMIGMVALLACAGLALDSGNLLLNKTRLQNIADTAALNAAQVHNISGDIVLAQAAVPQSILQNANMPGHKRFKEALASGDVVVTTEFSNTLNPFVNGSLPSRFVRVRITGFEMRTMFAQIVGVDRVGASVSAVSGPSPSLSDNVCDLAPMVLCGEPDIPGDDEIYGYPINEAVVLKHGSGQDSEIGAGNFQLARLPGSAGGADIRESLAGGYESENCASIGDQVATEPGNTVGPVVQGINTRFGQHQGPLDQEDYPGDWVDTAPEPALALDGSGALIFETGGSYTGPDSLSFNHSDYQSQYSSSGFDCESGAAGCQRRILTVPVGDCTGTTNGQGQVDVQGFVCVYLVQPAKQKGNEAHVFGQIVEGCNTEGRFGPDPVTGPLPTKIILYKDPDNVDA